jgi:HK97 family phage portal protein
VLFLRDRSDDGILGRSRISRAPEVLGAALGLQQWSSAIWATGATPSVVVKLPPVISPEGVARMKQHFETNHVGARNGRRVFYADHGAEVSTLSISPEDQEVLASRRFTADECARLMGVPPPLVGIWDHASFTNSETAGRWFATFSLAPWARRIESAFARTVFGLDRATHSVEIDLSALTRGDFEGRWAANVAAVDAGILTADEVRAAEGYGPRGKAAPAAEPAA